MLIADVNRSKLKRMEIVIENTAEKDFFQTENLTREAFWNMYRPGCAEHLILHNLRKSRCFVALLDRVAVMDGKLVGHIISTKARVVDDAGFEHEVLCVGPLSVLPEYQKMGIGSQLMASSIEIAGKLDFLGMILFGNPDYYCRFGFSNAQKYGITTKDGQNFEPFMALELTEHSLGNVKGKFFEDQAFTTREEELSKFEMYFPRKEKGEPKVDISHI